MSKIEVLEAKVHWSDRYENSPSLKFALNQMPQREVYEVRKRDDGWRIYWSEDDSFVWFFTYKSPDDGFGGWRRTVKLTDGTTEEVIGGWHSSSASSEPVGFPPVVDISICTHNMSNLGRVSFITADRFKNEVERLLPDVEVIDDKYNVLTVKWRGQPSKSEFMAIEHDRRDKVRDRLKEKYPGGSFLGNSDWYGQCSDEERGELACKPYSALGPASCEAVS
jgi:hypothetical protein